MLKSLRYSAAKQTLAHTFGSFSRGAGLVGIITGLAALCGWSVLPAFVIRHLWFISQIHPNTGFGFILVGFSLRLARFDGITSWVHPACRVFRISVGCLGLLSLVNIWFRLNLGIDRFLVRDPTAVMPGAMPAAAALCFYLLGCALIFLSARRSLTCQILSLAVTTITSATLVASGYALLAPPTLPEYLVMPAFSALILLVLSLGVVSANAGVTETVITSDSVGGALARRLLPASLLIPIVLGFLRLKGQDAGWFGPAMGLVLHVVATMFLLALFVWWNAVALDRLARENTRFESIAHNTQAAWLETLRHVDNAAFAHDLQGNLLFFNSAAEHLFAVPARDALRRNIYALIARQSAESARSILSSRLIGGVPSPESLVLCTGTGEQECAVLTTVIYDYKEKPAGYFSIVSPFFTAPIPDATSIDSVQALANATNLRSLPAQGRVVR